MLFANDMDIAGYKSRFDNEHTPRMGQLARTLERLKDWADNNSDGWAYWPKPVRSAKKAITILEAAERDYYRGAADQHVDIEEGMLRAALRPIRTFLKGQGVTSDIVAWITS